MKKMIIFGVALATLFTLGGCEKDGGSTPEPAVKKFVKQIVTYAQPAGEEATEQGRASYIYDANNRLTELAWAERGKTATTKYVYSADKVVVSTTFDGVDQVTTFLINDKGLISEVQEVDEQAQVSYDQGRIKRYINKTHDIHYTWADGDISTIEQYAVDGGKLISTRGFRYSKRVNNTNLNQFTSVYGLAPMVWTEYFGQGAGRFIEEVDDSGSEKVQYGYEFDLQGYPTRVIETNVDLQYKYIYEISY